MGDNIESGKTSKEMESLSLQNRIPRDLLQRFMEVRTSRQNELNAESGEIELNLGLSLGGRFGVDKSSSNLLVRSSSIAGAIPLVREEPEVLTPPATAAYTGLSRTSSLPVETEEEWRKRKEIQSLRRMEAKRRRSEKQRASKGDGSNKESEIEVNLRGRGGGGGGGQRQQYVADMNKVGSSVAPPLGLPSWAAAARQTILGGGIEALIARGRTKTVVGSGQASIDSQGGCSSSMSEMESTKAPPVSSSSGDISPAAIQSARNRSDQSAVGSSRSKSVENAGRPPRAEVQNPTNRTEATGSTASGMNSLEDMPCVFTKGDGPNGRRIEGILYKYGKGEDVRIMCVCHGDFYSPAGFVKHAGGTDIAHPLKHIVVNPNSS